MSLKAFREKYPQYNDLSDTELADSLHAKHYSDMPKADYYQRLGLTRTGEQEPTAQELAKASRPARTLGAVAPPERPVRVDPPVVEAPPTEAELAAASAPARMVRPMRRQQQPAPAPAIPAAPIPIDVRQPTAGPAAPAPAAKPPGTFTSAELDDDARPIGDRIIEGVSQGINQIAGSRALARATRAQEAIDQGLSRRSLRAGRAIEQSGWEKIGLEAERDRQAEQVAASGLAASSYPVNPNLQAMSEAGTYKDAYDAFARAPIPVLVDLIAQNAPSMAEQIATGLAAGIAAGPVGFVAGGATPNFKANFDASLSEDLQRAGFDITDPRSIVAALQDKLFMETALERARRYSAAVTGVDAASMGLATKTLVPGRLAARLGRPGTQVANVAAQVPVQVGMAGGSEVAGQVAKTGEVGAPGEVLAEMAAEVPGSIGEVLSGAAVAANQARKQATSTAGARPGAGPPPAPANAQQNQNVDGVVAPGPTTPPPAPPGQGAGVPLPPMATGSVTDLASVLSDERPLDVIRAEQAEQERQRIAAEQKARRTKRRNFVSSTEYAVDTEDDGKSTVKVHRTPDGGAVILTDFGVIEYNGAFANGKSDADLLAYLYEPSGFRSAAPAVGSITEKSVQQPADIAQSAGVPGIGEQATVSWPGMAADTGEVLDVFPAEDEQGNPTTGLEIRLADGRTLTVTTADAKIGPAPRGDGTRAAPIQAETSADVALAANRASADYTPEQGEANNRELGHVKWKGLEGSIEVPAGGTRKGTVPDTGQAWSTTHTVPYGYWRGTEGADGMHVDVYFGPDVEGDHPVFVLDEIDSDTGKFRQHKTFVGFPDEQSAVAAYLGTSSKRPEHVGGITVMSPFQFKNWLRNGDTKKALAYVQPKPSQQPPQGATNGLPNEAPAGQKAVPDAEQAGPAAAGSEGGRSEQAGRADDRQAGPAANPAPAVQQPADGVSGGQAAPATGQAEVPAQESVGKRKRAPAEITPAEAARRDRLRAKNAQRRVIDLNSDSLIDAVIKLGGITMRDRNDVLGDKKENRFLPFVGYLFSTKGRGIDLIASSLHDLGYITDEEYEDGGGVRIVAELIRAEYAGGEPRMALGNEMDAEAKMQAEVDRMRDMQEEAAQFEEAQVVADDIDLMGDVTPDDMADFGVDATPQNIALMDLVSQLDEDTIERLAIENTSDSAFEAAVRRVIQERQNAIDAENAQDNRGRQGGKEASPEPTTAADTAQAEEVAFLQAQTPADLKAKAEREADEAAGDKAIADRERDVFALTPQAAPAQEVRSGDMFGAAGLANQPSQKPRSAPEPTGGLFSKPANKGTVNVVKNPSGTWGYAGKVPDEIGYADGATPEQIRNGKQFGERFGPKQRTFNTSDEAAQYARANGYDVRVYQKPSDQTESQAASEPKIIPMSSETFEKRLKESGRGVAGGWTVLHDPLYGVYRLARKVVDRNQAGGGYKRAEAVSGIEFESVETAKDWARKNPPSAPEEQGRSVTNSDVAAERDAVSLQIEQVEAILDDEDLSIAAEELGTDKWDGDTAKLFLAEYAAWLQDKTREISETLKGLFVRVMVAARNGVLSIAVAVNFSAAPVAPPVKMTVTERNVVRVIEKPAADFKGVAASPDAKYVADRLARESDGKPFIVADKQAGLMYAFGSDGALIAKTPALFGKAKGDTLTAAQQSMDINKMRDQDKITPAGIFKAKINPDSAYGKVLSVAEYPGGTVSIHRVYLGSPSENRAGRLQSESADDNRISYGCINALPEFMEQVIEPHFANGGTVAILPETADAKSAFGLPEEAFEVEVRTAPSKEQTRVSWGSDKYADRKRMAKKARGMRRMESGSGDAGRIEPSKSAMLERGPDSYTADAETLANLFESETFRLEGFGGLDVPSQREVLHRVLSLGDDIEILRAIVELVPVDVVNILRRQQLSAESLFRNQAVLKKLLSADLNGSVSTAVDVADALVAAIAGMATERLDALPFVTRRDEKDSPAVRAGVGDSSHAGSIDQNDSSNDGTFDADDPSIVSNIERFTVQRMLQDHNEGGPKRIHVTKELRKLTYDAYREKLSAEEFRIAVEKLTDRIESAKSERDYRYGASDRVRDVDYVRERLLRARRTGDLSEDAVELALWVLDKNPDIATDLSIGIRKAPEGARGTSGNYNPVSRVVTLFKDSDNDDTAAHEFLHHAERMLPGEIRDGITTAWAKGLAAAFEKATPAQREQLSVLARVAAGERGALREFKALVEARKFDYDLYQFLNPSEYWAVNGSAMMRDRMMAERLGWIAQARQFLSELWEKIKEVLGLDNKAAVVRAIDAALEVTGERLHRDLIGKGDMYYDLPRNRPPTVADFAKLQYLKQWIKDSVSGPRSEIGAVGRKFGTMYGIGKTLAGKGQDQFLKVFWRGQDYLSDQAGMIKQAQQLAPDVLPGMDSINPLKLLGQLKKSASREDMRAVGKALNAGTLYGGGSPLKGRKWTREELLSGRAIDGGVSMDAFPALTEKQADYYQQVMRAMADMLTTFGHAMIVKQAQVAKVAYNPNLPFAELAREVRQAIEDRKAMLASMDGNELPLDIPDTDLLGKNIPSKASADETTAPPVKMDDLDIALKNITSITTKIRGLIRGGYFPLMRFGKYFIVVRDRKTAKQKYNPETGRNEINEETGDVKFFGRFDSFRSRNAALRQLEEEFQGDIIKTGEMPKAILFEGLNLDMLELFAEKAGLAESDAYQQYLKMATFDHSAMRRFIHRQGTPGFDEDPSRVLASFLVSTARNASGLLHLGEMLKLIGEVPKGVIGDRAANLYKYLTEGGAKEELAGVRSFIAHDMLLGTLAGGMVNMTQIPMATLPELAEHIGALRAAAEIMKAVRLAAKDPADIEGRLGDALRIAEKKGWTEPQEVYLIVAVAADRLFAKNPTVNYALKAWGFTWSAAEILNRRTTFIAAYQAATKRMGMTHEEAIEFAKEMIVSTQGAYNKGNRPEAFRGIGTVIFQFQTFKVIMLELLKRLPWPSRWMLLGMLWMASGIRGLPFYKDIDDIMATFWQWFMGGAGSPDKGIEELARAAGTWTMGEKAGNKAANMLMNGISEVMPFDVSARLGLGDIIPGTGALRMDNPNSLREASELLGVAASRIADTIEAIALFGEGKTKEAAYKASPRGVASYAKSVDMAITGTAKDSRGGQVMEVDLGDAWWRFVGFNPQKLAAEGRVVHESAKRSEMTRMREKKFIALYIEAEEIKDPADRAAASKEIAADVAEWNKNNPDYQVDPSVEKINAEIRRRSEDREERAIKRAPKGTREALKRDFEEAR